MYEHDPKDKKSLSYNLIENFSVDADKSMWVATRKD
jgi:hypothetical protein